MKSEDIHRITLRWRTLCLAFLLITGQAALLQHVVAHDLEHAITQEQDGDQCSFCAIGGHTASNALPPPLSHPFEWTEVVYFNFTRDVFVVCDINLFDARGPPFLFVA